MYFVIRANEDGECSCEAMTKNILLERLNEEYWGEIEIPDNKIPEHWDCDMAMNSGLLIIEGEVIVPKPKISIKEYALK